MSAKECEKIIDRAIENNKADAATEAHARTCPKCASTLALLALFKTSGSPTSDLKPSAAFLARIENNLTVTDAGVGTFKAKVIAVAIGAALTATIALTMLSDTGKSDTQNGKTVNTGSVNSQETSPASSGNSSEIRPEIDDTTFPQMKFPSPADDIR